MYSKNEDAIRQFQCYADGFGYGNISVRLSNFSLSNIPRNFCFFVGLGSVAAENVAFTVVNTLNGVQHLFHYKVEGKDSIPQHTSFNIITFEHFTRLEPIPVNLEYFKKAILKGSCNVTYVPERQYEYNPLQFKSIYALYNSLPGKREAQGCLDEYVLNSGKPYFTQTSCLFYGKMFPDIVIKRDASQINPLFGNNEDCLKHLVDKTYDQAVKQYQVLENEYLAFNEKGAADLVETLVKTAPYLITTAAVAGFFSLGYQYWQSKKAATSELTFQKRLENINYQGEIPICFLCPISRLIMNDPVLTSGNISYDRTSKESLKNLKIDEDLKQKINAFVNSAEEAYKSQENRSKRI